MKRTDFLWLLALPIFQILGTTRHELSHAAAAWLQGARITEIQVLPSWHPSVGLLWGYVRHEGGRTGWLTVAAPYLVDALLFLGSAVILPYLRSMPRWARLHVIILGMILPWVDVAYNYGKALLADRGDVEWLLARLPSAWVHGAMVAAVMLMGTDLVRRLRAFPN